jgi:hypothetical protein
MLQRLKCNGVELRGEREGGSGDGGSGEGGNDELTLGDFGIRNRDTVLMSRICITPADPLENFDISQVPTVPPHLFITLSLTPLPSFRRRCSPRRQCVNSSRR